MLNAISTNVGIMCAAILEKLIELGPFHCRVCKLTTQLRHDNKQPINIYINYTLLNYEERRETSNLQLFFELFLFLTT